MSSFLDETAKFPGNNKSIEEYARACSDAVDEASVEWPVVERTKHGAVVSTGFVGDNRLRSTLWTQSFDLATGDGDVGETFVFEDLLANLKDVFSSEDVEKHAKTWDDTFAGAKMVGRLSNGDKLVHWKFNAPPLSGRDMLFVVHERKEEPSSQSNYNRQGDSNNGNDSYVLRLTYAYASVSDEWARDHSGQEIDLENDSDWIRRVRALNCYPSCDRITVYDNPSSPGREMKITLDHLMTSDMGGCIVPFCFNNLFKKALIRAYVHECEALREYIISLCKSSS